MKHPVLIIGAGGHGRVVADALRVTGRQVLGFLDNAPSKHGCQVDELPVLGDDSLLRRYSPDRVRLCNGIGSTKTTAQRRRVYERLTAAGYQFDSVIHPSAVISRSVKLGTGVQVMAGTVLQAGVEIGANTIINTGAVIDHDCRIGSHCHIAPSAVLSGDVSVDDDCHVGTSAAVRQGVRIGRGALIAAGAVVIAEVEPGLTIVGVPGKPLVRA